MEDWFEVPFAAQDATTGEASEWSSRAFMRLIESFGLTGAWRWDLTSGEQAWSPGLYRILGQPETRQGSYDLLLSMVHPEDRDQLEDPAEIAESGLIGNHVFRLVRPDDSVRTLTSRGEVFFSPQGRPLVAAGIVSDVTERERLVELQRREQQRRSALARQARVFVYTEATLPLTQYGPDFLALTGLRRADIQQNWLVPIARQEWPRWREEVPRLAASERPFMITPTLRLAEGESAPFRMTFVPLGVGGAAPEAWTAVIAPQTGAPGNARLNQPGPDPAVEGRHIRAARGFLDWTLNDLAQASGLSLSTVRRLEENGEGPGARSRPLVLAALRSAGIVFTVIEGGGIAVSRAA